MENLMKVLHEIANPLLKLFQINIDVSTLPHDRLRFKDDTNKWSR